ncbi:Mpo1 family 2-hydroxy fatty acid dioxygenase [Woeseia oceani]|nr:Mpo1-like protein [Woeseia oceani]
MKRQSRLLEMLTGYAAAHQHPVNIAVHMVGIPAIMFGALIALGWVSIEFGQYSLNLAWLLVLGFFLFYLTLDTLFALVFLIVAGLLAALALQVSALPTATSVTVAAVCFFGGYLAQFIGHAIEKSQPVLLKHPIQAQLAAPFFTVVEAFKLLGLRDELFTAVQTSVANRRKKTTDSG